MFGPKAVLAKSLSMPDQRETSTPLSSRHGHIDHIGGIVDDTVP